MTTTKPGSKDSDSPGVLGPDGGIDLTGRRIGSGRSLRPTLRTSVDAWVLDRSRRSLLPAPPVTSPPDEREVAEDAYAYMELQPGAPIRGTRIDVAFIGSCTNGRLSDLREAARVAALGRVASHVKALVVPGSQEVATAAEAEGLHEVFERAGFEWRLPGCSMCLAMNPDKLVGRQVCASSSNRNFKGRQGSPTGRTLLMSPAVVAAAAIRGEVTDVRAL